MIFYSTYDILDEVYYKKELPGVIVSIQFELDEDSHEVKESYGVLFDNNSFEMFINPSDLTYRQVILGQYVS